MSDELGNPGATAPAGPLVPAQMPPPEAPAAVPRIPPPPPGRGQPIKKSADLRWLIWLGALLLGVGLGVVAYQWLPGVDDLFETWVALALG